jgi:Caenorhabditis protein of unknown function, DUF268
MLSAVLRNAGIHPRRVLSALRGWRRYVRDRAVFRRTGDQNAFAWGKELPILTEWDESSGSLGTYFYQDQLVARWIHEDSPSRHVDVGSRLDGFVGSLSVFREVEVLDIRPQHETISNVKFHQLDLMLPLPEKWIDSTPSLSCLHTIEHFGLGRYGDAIDPEGHLKGLAQLKKMVMPSGLLYLSTPIGPQRIEFNAHRIFAPETVLSWFDDGWEIVKCAVLGDDNQMQVHAGVDGLKSFKGNLGLGILCVRKR